MKKGFTLAETLITLAVIGVVASLTIPNLVTANNKKLYASALASNVSNIEHVLSSLISKQNLNWLEETDFYEDITSSNLVTKRQSAGELGSYLDISGFGTTAAIAESPGYTEGITGLNGTADNSIMSTGFFYKLKNGALINFETVNNPVTASDNNRLVKQIFVLNIDINGIAKPNKCGRDIFKFAVDTSGKLFPYGGSAYNEYSSEGKWDTGANNLTCPGTGLGYGCAGRLADNGYVMDY